MPDSGIGKLHNDSRPQVDPTVMVSHPAASPKEAGRPEIKLQGAGINPLVDAAGILLAIMTRLRGLAQHDDPAHLRLTLVNEMRSFETSLDQRGYERATILAARYCLCTAVDEAVLATSWGAASGWSAQSLLSTFHNETWGGEKFFLILGRAMEEPARYGDLLEFLYICLRLGFEGRFNIIENGKAKLDMLMENIYGIIRPRRGEYDPSLSGHWQGTLKARRKIRELFDGRWLLLACLIVTVGLFIHHLHQLHGDAAQLQDHFAAAERFESTGAR